MIKTKEFIAWERMRDRCRNKNYHSYHRYGGKGITVCERWKGVGGFNRFLEDVGFAPSTNHTLDRFPNKDGNYEPGNVRWATPKEQSENKDNTRFLEYNGKRLTTSEWAIEVGLPAKTIRNRIDYGWPVDKILSTPTKKRKKYVSCDR